MQRRVSRKPQGGFGEPAGASARRTLAFAGERRLVSPTGRPIRLAPVRPNAGIRRNYQAKLDRLVGEMHRSLLYWLSALGQACIGNGVPGVTRGVKGV